MWALIRIGALIGEEAFISIRLPACRRLLFPLLHATKEIGDVCTQASIRELIEMRVLTQ